MPLRYAREKTNPVIGVQLYQLFYGRESMNSKVFMLINHASLPLLDAVMPAVTFLGDPQLSPLYGALFLALYFFGPKVMPGRYVAVYFLAALISLGAESLLKELFHLPRPPFVLGAGSVRLLGPVNGGYSFPSGHAVFSFMTAFTLSCGRGARWKIILFSLAGLVGYSRVYLGDHYPLDVAAGALVGVASALASWKLFAMMQHWFGGLKGKRG